MGGGRGGREGENQRKMLNYNFITLRRRRRRRHRLARRLATVGQGSRGWQWPKKKYIFDKIMTHLLRNKHARTNQNQFPPPPPPVL